MSLPWFKFKVKAFLTDTMRLTTEQRGAYLLLMLDYHEHEGPARDDDETLAAITGLPLERWQRHRTALEPFFQIKDGFWHHDKFAKTLAEGKHIYGITLDKARAATAAAKAKRDAAKAARGETTEITRERPRGETSRRPSRDPEFGPAASLADVSTAKSGSIQPESPPAVPAGIPTGTPRGETRLTPQEQEHSLIREDSANAESGAFGFSLIPLDFELKGSSAAALRDEFGLTFAEIATWFDEWKAERVKSGALVDDWPAAWERHARKLAEQAAKKAKPRVAVSKVKKIPVPEGWEPKPKHGEVMAEEGYDPNEVFRWARNWRDLCAANGYVYASHDAAFTNYIRNQKNFQRGGKPNGQAPSTRGSIVSAADRAIRHLEASIADDHEDGEAAV